MGVSPPVIALTECTVMSEKMIGRRKVSVLTTDRVARRGVNVRSAMGAEEGAESMELCQVRGTSVRLVRSSPSFWLRLLRYRGSSMASTEVDFDSAKGSAMARIAVILDLVCWD